MRSGKTDLKLRPNTLKENKRVLCELRRRSKIDRKSLDETNRLVAKFNAKNALGLSKNAGASHGQKQEKKVDNLYGAVAGFAPGSWWGIRMDCSRDGVHEPFDRDLREGPFGVVSLCTSHSNVDNDVDLGDSLTLTGGEYSPEESSPQPLLKNYQNRLPLRLIRSYNLSNDYAPKTGYRYDGLYSVVGCWLGVTSDSRKLYKFALARLTCRTSPSCQLSRAQVQETRRGIIDGSLSIPNDEESTRNTRPVSLMTKCPLTKLNSPSCHESAIVTRCTSKKYDGQSCRVRPETLVYERPEQSAASPVCKFQNTNISIRTDLYDSSNVSQETRRVAPVTFCRTYKNSRLAGRAINHSNVVVALNLNSCGPCPRENEPSSLIQSRSGNSKFSFDQSPSFDHAEPVANEPKTKDGSKARAIEETGPYDEKRRKFSSSEDSKERSAVGSDEKIRTFRSTSAEDPHADLDSLTPDEMLNFIVEQKCHPRAKLLIGSVIGLATGESTILRAYESLVSRKNSWSRNDETKSLPEKKNSSDCDDENSREQRDEDSTKNLRTTRGPEGKDRHVRKRTLRRTRVSKRLMIGADKKPSCASSRQKNAGSQRLRKSNIPEMKKSQQPFSKSTVAKKSKKNGKKRRGELANLVIDAKIGPLIRGPRNRRLRCQAHVYAKKPIGVGGGKKKIAEVPARKSRVTATKSLIAESRFKPANKRERANGASDTSKTRTMIGDKRKSSSSREKRTSEETRKIERDSGASRVIERVKMIDAATQCSTTRRDVTTSVDREVVEKSLNSIKIEWIDVDDVKSEICQDGVDFQSSIGPRAESTLRSSAFVPVNAFDRDFRIARLRSIGFKPIRPDGVFGDEDQSPGTSDEVSSVTAAVASREVYELFDKYTSEETTTVGYMDHELRYQDIEDEAIGNIRARKSRINHGRARRGGRAAKRRDQSESTRNIVGSNETDSEVPWHGWKKFVTDKQAQWVGW